MTEQIPREPVRTKAMTTDIVAAHSHFPPEVVEHAKALAVRGFSLRRIEYALRSRFSDGDTPTYNTIHGWVKQWTAHDDLEQLRNEQLTQNELEAAAWADDLVFEKLKYLEGKPEKSRLSELTLAAGLYRDKYRNAQAPTQGSNVSVFVGVKVSRED